MLEKVELKMLAVADIVGDDDITLLSLTDVAQQRLLTIVCDNMMKQQIIMRMQHQKVCNTMCPEVLSNVIKNQLGGHFEIILNDVIDGVYRAMLINDDTYQPTSMRASDAILLHLAGNIPLYATKQLMQRQSVRFDPKAPGVSLPFNSLSNEMLHVALKKAIDEEQYEVASKLNEELKRRGNA